MRVNTVTIITTHIARWCVWWCESRIAMMVDGGDGNGESDVMVLVLLLDVARDDGDIV